MTITASQEAALNQAKDATTSRQKLAAAAAIAAAFPDVTGKTIKWSDGTTSIL